MKNNKSINSRLNRKLNIENKISLQRLEHWNRSSVIASRNPPVNVAASLTRLSTGRSGFGTTLVWFQGQLCSLWGPPASLPFSASLTTNNEWNDACPASQLGNLNNMQLPLITPPKWCRNISGSSQCNPPGNVFINTTMLVSILNLSGVQNAHKVGWSPLKFNCTRGNPALSHAWQHLRALYYMKSSKSSIYSDSSLPISWKRQKRFCVTTVRINLRMESGTVKTASHSV